MASSTRYEQGIPLAVRKISKKVRVVTQGQNRWKGLVRDLSLKGLRAASPKRPSFRGGQVLQLEINTDVIGESDPIIADAKCDWIKKKGNRIRYFVVGFYLTDIGAETKGRLEKLIRALLGQPQQSIGTETSIIQIHEVLFKDDLGEGFNQLDFELTHELVLSDERPGLPHSKEEASSDSIAGDSDKSSET